MFSFCLCHCHCLCHKCPEMSLYLFFVSKVLSPLFVHTNHSDQMSQKSKVSGVALWVFSKCHCFLLVMSSLPFTLITCIKGYKSLRVLYGSVFQQCGGGRERGSQSVSKWVSDKVTYWAVWGQLKSVWQLLSRNHQMSPARGWKWKWSNGVGKST